jgi:outer membrane protein assembly factor BamE (lipoprotein component of BamABCDE complex)
MARRRPRDDDSGEYDRPGRARSGGIPVWVILFAAAGAIGIMCSGVGAVYFLTAARPAAEQPQVPTERVYTRDEFRKLVVGMTKAKLLAEVGTPVSTAERGETGVVFYYSDRTVDPVTNRKDSWVPVYLENGIVIEVRF